MAGTKITVSTEEVMAIASRIDSDNKRLEELLQESKTTLEGLGSTWTGKAAEQTRTAYASFSQKFFQQYFDILDQYVKFLRSNVSAGYEETETGNISLADQFK